MVGVKCNKCSNGIYEFKEIDEFGLNIWVCKNCGDEQIPETM
jgi:hypothetical protein